MNTVEKNIELLANWWADQATGRRLNWDNGDRTDTGLQVNAISNFLIAGIREQTPVADSARLEYALKKLLLAEYEQTGELPTLRVDYSPVGLLGEAAKEAGINMFAFPCKTYTKVIDGKPFASCGYGQPLVELFDTQKQAT